MRRISFAQPVVGASVLIREHLSNDQPRALPLLRGPTRRRSFVSSWRRCWRSL